MYHRVASSWDLDGLAAIFEVECLVEGSWMQGHCCWGATTSFNHWRESVVRD